MMRLLLVVMLTLGSAPSVLAATITVTWSFGNAPGNQATEPPDAQPLNAFASDIMRGLGLIPARGTGSFNSSDWPTSATPDLASDYYEWAIGPDAGYELAVTGIAFTYARSDTGPRDIALYSSAVGFTIPLWTLSLQADTDNHRATIDSSFLRFLGSSTDPHTFRLAAFNAFDSAGTFRLGVDDHPANADLERNLVLTGELNPVPETTSSLVLLCFGIGGMVATMKMTRRKKATKEAVRL